MIVQESPRSTVEESVRECFATDRDLLKRWHVEAPANLEKCVARTVTDIDQAGDDFRFFRVFIKNRIRSVLAGYWGTEGSNYLNLIFVKPKYRNRWFMRDFWDAIQASLESPFRTVIYAKNEQAITFYMNRGSKVKEFIHNGRPVVAFEFEKGAVCQ